MADTLRQRRAPPPDTQLPPVPPLGEDTNGHAIVSPDAGSSNDYPTPTTSETGERAKVSQADRAMLRLSSPQRLLRWSEDCTDSYVWRWLLLLRILNAIITSRTVFAPDEHWQSLEIAHRIVFGYGHRTWEWIDRRPPRERIWGPHWGDGPIRSVAYPALFVPAFWLLKVVHLDATWLLTLMPSIIQAIFAATTDMYTFKLARKLLNERAAWASLLVSLCSMYTFHTTTRTLSNSLEATLTTAALYHWPLSLPEDSASDLNGVLPLIDDVDLLKSVALFASSTALRPSNVLLSLPLLFMLVHRVMKNVTSAATALEATFALLVVVRTFVMVGFSAMLALLAVDSIYYQRLTFTPLGFLKRNVLQGISLFYGASPFHFYITSALPFLGFTLLPFALRGLWFALKRPPVSAFDKQTRRWLGFRGEQDPVAIKVLADAAVIFVLLMSVLGHKEVRFLQPIVPVMHVMQGYALALLPPIRNPSWLPSVEHLNRRTDDGQEALARQARSDRTKRGELLQSLMNFTSWQGRRFLLPAKPTWRSRMMWDKMQDVVRFVRVWHGKTVVWLLAANVVPIVYLSLHSSGQVRVAEEVGRLSRAGKLHSIGYLMPCHSTPYMSHMHSPDLALPNRAWFITCEPPLDKGIDRLTYRDESDDFYDDPYGFLVDRLGSSARPWPSHLALFEALLAQNSKTGNGTVASVLEEHGYTIQKRFWNSLVHLDRRRRGQILLLQRQHA